MTGPENTTNTAETINRPEDSGKLKRLVSALKPYIPAAGSGILMALAFPKAGFYPAGWAALVPLLVSLPGLSLPTAAGAGLVFGLSFYSATVYWVVIAMNHYGGLPLLVAVPALLLLAAYLGLYSAAACLACAWFGRKIAPGENAKLLRGAAIIGLFPVFWTAADFLRGKVFTGFPWAKFGHAQYVFTPIIQISDIAGEDAVTFLIAVANAAIALLVIRSILPAADTSPNTARFAKFAFYYAAVSAISIAFAWGYGHYRIAMFGPDSGIYTTRAERIALVQGNIPQSEKWEQSRAADIVTTYIRLSEQAVNAHAGGGENKLDLIVWPETAFPYYFQEETVSSSAVRAMVRDTETSLILGSPAYHRAESSLGESSTGISYANRAYFISGSTGKIDFYDKVHLVPFGEYVPFRRLLFFLGNALAAIGEMTPGGGFNLMGDKNPFGTLICYELIFPEISSAYASAGASYLVNITNDAWYDRSAATYQHIAMGSFRAVETRLPIVRAANTGVTATIDPVGRIHDPTPIFTTTVLNAPIHPMDRTKIKGAVTIYGLLGNWFPWLMVVISALALGLAGKTLPGSAKTD